MPQGNYDHPSYVARQLALLGVTTAGANGTTTTNFIAPWDVNIHNVTAIVKTAGTSATTGNKVFLLAGTSTITAGSVTLGSSTAGVSGTSGDAAFKVTAGTQINIKNGTDATGVAVVTFDYNIAPDTGTWVGNE